MVWYKQGVIPHHQSSISIIATSGDKGAMAMALTSMGFYMTVSLIGFGENTTSLNVELQGADYATALANAQTFITNLEAVTDGEIASYSVRELFEETALVVPITASAQAEVSASVTAYIAGKGSKKANIRIPIPKPLVFQATSGADSNRVDLTDSLVLAYLQMFQTTGEAFISDGENMASGGAISGVRVTRAKRGG